MELADREFTESVVSRFDVEEDQDRRSFRFFVTRHSLLSNPCSTRFSSFILLLIKVFANISQNSFHVESRITRTKIMQGVLNKRTRSKF